MHLHRVACAARYSFIRECGAKAMSQNRKAKTKRGKGEPSPRRWVLTVFVLTILISAVFSFLSDRLLSSAALIGALAVLLLIVLIGIAFDMLGLAVTAVDQVAIHGMASRRMKGAAEAADLIKNASRVSSVCCDVIGDVCGIVSGSATVVIAGKLLARTSGGGLKETLIPLGMSALAAALTVSGKAIGKIAAMKNATQIVYFAGRIVSVFRPKKKR